MQTSPTTAEYFYKSEIALINCKRITGDNTRCSRHVCMNNCKTTNISTRESKLCPSTLSECAVVCVIHQTQDTSLSGERLPRPRSVKDRKTLRDRGPQHSILQSRSASYMLWLSLPGLPSTVLYLGAEKKASSYYDPLQPAPIISGCNLVIFFSFQKSASIRKLSTHHRRWVSEQKVPPRRREGPKTRPSYRCSS